MRHKKYLEFQLSSKVLLAASSALVCLGAYQSPAFGEVQVELSPHRAVYDMVLDTASDRSGIANISARLVYELKGSSCEGFTLNIRLISSFTTKTNKKNTTDTRISSFEGEQGASFQYTSQQFLNQVQIQKYRGQVKRQKDEVTAVQEEPSLKKYNLPKEAIFPSQHTIKVLQAAHEGKTLLTTVYFDGSDGLEPFRVSSIIGKNKVPGSVNFKSDFPSLSRLKVLSSWPVVMSYFKKAKASSGEQVPAYEMSMLMFEDGVASRIKLTYSDFSIKGHLVDLEYFPPAKCD